MTVKIHPAKTENYHKQKSRHNRRLLLIFLAITPEDALLGTRSHPG